MFRNMMIFALLVAASASPVVAVDTLQVSSPDPILEGWRWTEFDRSSGLAGPVMNIFEDRDGNVWFATDRGAQRYDGMRWTTYTTADGLTSDRVWSIAQTRDGAMWFGTFGGGISRFDGETWTTYTTADGLATNTILWEGLLQARDGTLWAGFWSSFADTLGTQSGISRFDGETWTTIEVPVGSPRPPIMDIHQASDGALWFTTWGHGVLRFDRSGWTRYTAEDGLAGNWAGQIVESRDGSLWVGFGGGVEGISRFDGKGWRTYTVRDGLSEGVTFGNLWQTEDGTVWAGSGGRGGVLCRFDGERWKPYAPEEIPQVSGNVGGVPMRDGAVWIYDWRAEKAFRFDPVSTRWTVYEGILSAGRIGAGRSGGAPDLIFSFGDEMWFGGNQGAVRYDGRTWTRFTAADGLIDGPVLTILKDRDGALWFGGQHRGKRGAARYNGTDWRVFTEADGLVGGNIYTGLVADNGDLWFGTKLGAPPSGSGHGAIRYDGTAWTVYTTEEGLADNMIYDIAQTPDGVVWFGTANGLSRFDGSEWTRYTPGERQNPDYHRINALSVAQDGSLWMGHAADSRGVTRYDGKTWTRYTARDGLGSDVVNSIYRGRDGVLWFGSRGGLSRFDGANWTTYSDEDIPALFGTNISSICESADGVLWLRGNLGPIIRFQPESEGPETVLEPAVDQVSSAGNILLNWSGRDRWDLTAPQDIRYQWRMDGDEWFQVSNRTDFTFTSLSSGRHRFEVRAVDRDQKVDPTPAIHAFVVEAPWWRNPWMIGVTVVLLGGMGLQTGRVIRRDRRLQETNAAMSDTNKELFGVNQELQQRTDDLQQKTEDLDRSNRELTVEAALERVRAKALGMQESRDLADVAVALWEELPGVGISIRRPGITLLDLESNAAEIWTTSDDGEPMHTRFEAAKLRTPFGDHIQPFEEGDRSHRYQSFDRDEFAQVIEYLRDELGLAFPDYERDGAPELTHWLFVYFSNGYMVFNTRDKKLPEEEIVIAQRFVDVFDLAYSRFLELREKEERNRELEEANRAMSEANKELFQANQALQRDSAVERIRGEVQAMEQASDFERVLSVLAEDLKTVGLSFDTCGIDVLDEPVDEPTMAYFEEHGFQYTTYTIDPEGRVTDKSYHVSAPFPEVIQETIERFIAGEPWKALIGGTNAILEVPASNYGRLRITSSERQDFTEEDIDALRDFASAIALGYARYLDIREIQEQTERKSAFLANMSHELRTPMNAIIGFTRMVLRREKNISERNRENLDKVRVSADHLLNLINGILDLSKIESGQTDVTAEPFDVQNLIAGCCAAVEPLVEAKPGLKLEYTVSEDVGEANTDQGRLRQIVINLLSNGIKFTDQGEVAVRVWKDGQAGDGAGLGIAVSDTGTGIPADALESIFEEFQQVKGSDPQHKGTGLGLPITKGFAELLGGSIGVQSEVGKGSTFTVRIPFVYNRS